MSLASVSRYMTAMERLGVFQRERQPGSRYVYQLAEAYRPRWPARSKIAVPALKPRVPQDGTQQVNPTKYVEKRHEITDESAQWAARLRGWRQSGGRFWNPFWGPKPNEPGCFAPSTLLSTT